MEKRDKDIIYLSLYSANCVFTAFCFYIVITVFFIKYYSTPYFPEALSEFECWFEPHVRMLKVNENVGSETCLWWRLPAAPRRSGNRLLVLSRCERVGQFEDEAERSVHAQSAFSG